MAILPILTWPDARLTQVCTPLGTVTDQVRDLAFDMLETMYDAPGRGLAAPQVGVLSRLFVMDVAWKTGEPAPLICIDPDLVWLSDDTAPGIEGCLSIPGATAEVTRASRLRLRWTDLDGVRQERDFDGAAAICIQHEYDHLEGTVIFDRLYPTARSEFDERYAAAQAQDPA